VLSVPVEPQREADHPEAPLWLPHPSFDSVTPQPGWTDPPGGDAPHAGIDCAPFPQAPVGFGAAAGGSETGAGAGPG
jgi:hypothetical protein